MTTRHPPTDELPRGWQTIQGRVTGAVTVVFLATMAVFLVASYRAERERHFEATLDHLSETLRALTVAAPSTAGIDAATLLRMESSLGEAVGVEHRLLWLDPAGSIALSTDPELTGRPLDEVFRAERTREGSDSELRLDSPRSGSWLAAIRELGPKDDSASLVLLRDRAASESFALGFVRLHLLHVLSTLLAFVVLLHVAGKRYLRDPLGKLARAISGLESGARGADLDLGRNDEIGWLARRFDAMVRRLHTETRDRVRAEKRASAAAVVFRLGTELVEPLGSLERHIAYIDALGQRDPEIRRVSEELRGDRRTVLAVLRRLEETVAGSTEAEDRGVRDESGSPEPTEAPTHS